MSDKIMSRRTDNITRVDIRLPNYLYDRVVDIATHHFHAKIHHRSGKPEVSPTILELIKIGIEHLESTLPATNVTEPTVTAELREQIEDLNRRLQQVKAKLSGVKVNPVKPKAMVEESQAELSDSQLSDIIQVSSAVIRRDRLHGKQSQPQGLLDKLREWEIKGEGWVKKS